MADDQVRPGRVFGWQRPNEFGFTPDPREHFEKVGHTVRVATPGAPPMSGVLVSVGSDRLVLHTDAGLAVVDRLISTRVTVEP